MAERGAINIPAIRNRTIRPQVAKQPVGKSASGDDAAATSGTLPNAVTKAAQCRELAERIARDIRLSTGKKIRHLCVEVEGDKVLLAGTCSTFYAKQLAQHAAIQGAGQRSISNQIEVV